MAEVLQYTTEGRGYVRVIRRLANVSLLLPLAFPLCLYAEWCVTWIALGHPPRAFIDDPASRMLNLMTGASLLGFLPLSLLAFISNTCLLIFWRPSAWGVTTRIGILLCVTVGVFILVRLDPGGLVNWWMD